MLLQRKVGMECYRDIDAQCLSQLEASALQKRRCLIRILKGKVKNIFAKGKNSINIIGRKSQVKYVKAIPLFLFQDLQLSILSSSIILCWVSGYWDSGSYLLCLPFFYWETISDGQAREYPYTLGHVYKVASGLIVFLSYVGWQFSIVFLFFLYQLLFHTVFSRLPV